MSLERTGTTSWTRGGTMYEQKDIILVPFPYSDLTQAKQRPALIVSNKNLNKTQDRICCLITSNPSGYRIKINNDCFKEGKLPFNSWIKPYRLFTIHEQIIRKKLCSINDGFYDKIIGEINGYIRRV